MRMSIVVKSNPYLPRLDQPEVLLLLNDMCESFSVDHLARPCVWEIRHIPEGHCFYWCPKPDGKMRKVRNNATGWKGEVSNDAFGIIATMYFLSHMSFSIGNEATMIMTQVMSTLYHNLRNMVFEDRSPHPEHTSIFEATD